MYVQAVWHVHLINHVVQSVHPHSRLGARGVRCLPLEEAQDASRPIRSSDRQARLVYVLGVDAPGHEVNLAARQRLRSAWACVRLAFSCSWT